MRKRASTPDTTALPRRLPGPSDWGAVTIRSEPASASAVAAVSTSLEIAQPAVAPGDPLAASMVSRV